MDGLDPGGVTPETAAAYATGEGNGTTAAGRAERPARVARVMPYAAIDRLLRVRLFRVECPPTLALGELALGLLEREDALELRQHVATCPHCAAELTTIDESLRVDLVE